MKTRTAVILFAICFFIRPLLQVFLPQWLTLDLILCIFISLAITMDSDKIAGPMLAAFIFMVISDILFSQYKGATPIAMLIATGCAYLIKSRYDKENYLLNMVNMVVSFLVFHISYWLMYKLLGTPYSFVYMLVRLPWLLLTECVITGIIIFIIIRARIQKRRTDYFK